MSNENQLNSIEQVWEQNHQLIRKFLDKRPNHEKLCQEIAYILSECLKESGIEIANLTYRAKTLNSFLEKIERKNYKKPLSDITDFAGVRIVYLYAKDFIQIEKIIYEKFNVIEKIDKLKEKGVDQFGYSAIQYIVKLGKSLSGARYDDVKDFVCEIQVRTVLQDAWAIIDHHLVYKKESDVPEHLRRKLNSLAALLETADDQFDHIREERQQYISEIRNSQINPQKFLNTDLNKDSFFEYLSWKFPTLKIGRLDTVFSSLAYYSSTTGKYKKLIDIDNDIERTKDIILKIESEALVSGTFDRYLDESSLRVMISLLLVNNDLRKRWGFSQIYHDLIEKYAIKQ